MDLKSGWDKDKDSQRQKGVRMKDLTYIGKRIVREDSYDKACGRTQFICDRVEAGMLYAKLVLSTKAHSDIRIDPGEALRVPGVVAVYSFEDVPKVKFNSHNWTPVITSPQDQYILSDRARYVGDHLALVVGENKEAVEEGVRKVKVEYEPLPAVITLREAIAQEKEQLAFSKELSYGSYEAISGDADYKIVTRGSTQKIHHAALEPHIALSKYDELGNLVLWTPCQTVYQVRYHICHLLKLPYARVRVIKAVMGGSFGGKGHTVLEPACAFATYKLKKPVMLYMDRKDAIIATRTRNAVHMQVETAVKKDGTILGRDIQCEIDGGAYYTNASAVAMALAKKLNRLYRMDHQRIKVKTFYTNTIPGGPCRGYGSPQAHAITEVNLDEAARALHMDPCELRLKNIVKPFDPDPTGGTNLGNAQVEACIRLGMEQFHWKEKYNHIGEKNSKRYAYGVGMSACTHGNGYHGAYPDFTSASMELQWDGGVDLKIGIHDQGCGTILTMQQIAGEALRMNPMQITVHEADTFITPYDSAGTQASRVTFVCGKAVQEAATLLKERLLRACLELYGWEADQICLEDGHVYYQNEKKQYGEITMEYEKLNSRGMSVNLEFESRSNPASYASGFTQVKIDRYTGLITVEEYLAVHDIGRVMNYTLAEGQVAGGVQMSLGMALYEEIDIDGAGMVRSTNFSKYHIINAPDMPKVNVVFVEEGEQDGPYGGKSLGEVAAVCPAPAVVNAINHALGSHFSHYPVKPEHIVAFLEEQTR